MKNVGTGWLYGRRGGLERLPRRHFLFGRSLFRPGVFHGNATALGWTGLGRGASLHADVFEIPAKGDDAVIEADAGCASAELAYFEGCGGFARDVESLAIAVGSEEDVVLDAGVDGLGEIGIEIDDGGAARKLLGAEIFKPVFG